MLMFLLCDVTCLNNKLPSIQPQKQRSTKNHGWTDIIGRTAGGTSGYKNITGSKTFLQKKASVPKADLSKLKDDRGNNNNVIRTDSWFQKIQDFFCGAEFLHIISCHRGWLNWNDRLSSVYTHHSLFISPLSESDIVFRAALSCLPIILSSMSSFLFYLLSSLLVCLSTCMPLGSDSPQKAGLQPCHVSLWLQGQYQTCPWRWQCK